MSVSAADYNATEFGIQRVQDLRRAPIAKSEGGWHCEHLTLPRCGGGILEARRQACSSSEEPCRVRQTLLDEVRGQFAVVVSQSCQFWPLVHLCHDHLCVAFFA